MEGIPSGIPPLRLAGATRCFLKTICKRNKDKNNKNIRIIKEEKQRNNNSIYKWGAKTPWST